MTIHPIGGPSLAPPTAKPARDPEIWKVAQDFETVFLAEMLGKAGLGKVRSENSGGPGEEAFASLLAREQAALMVERGGIGLTTRIYTTLASREAGK